MRISARLDTRFRKYDMTACVSTTTYIPSESKWVSCVACAVKAWFHLQWCTVFLGLQGKKLERMQSVNQPILWGEELLELDMDKFLMLLLTLNYPEQHVGFFSVGFVWGSLVWDDVLKIRHWPKVKGSSHITTLTFCLLNPTLLAKGISQNCIQTSLVIKSSRNFRLLRLRLGALLFRLAAAHADMWVMLIFVFASMI